LIVAVACLLAGCKTETTTAAAGTGGVKAEAKKEESKEAPPACPPYRWKGKDLCRVDYNSYKEIILDGKSAEGKRARLTCEFQSLEINRSDNELYVDCRTSVAEGFKLIKIYDAETKTGWSPEKKQVISRLKNRTKISVDLAIAEVGAFGVNGSAFTINGAGAKLVQPPGRSTTAEGNPARGAPNGEVRPLGVDITNPIDPAAAPRIVLGQGIPVIRTCYQEALKQDSRLAGTATARFAVTKQGSVSSVSITPASFSKVANCVQGQVGDWRFPPMARAAAVSLKLSFETMK
jgi:hypothetical protein